GGRWGVAGGGWGGKGDGGVSVWGTRGRGASGAAWGGNAEDLSGSCEPPLVVIGPPPPVRRRGPPAAAPPAARRSPGVSGPSVPAAWAGAPARSRALRSTPARSSSAPGWAAGAVVGPSE